MDKETPEELERLALLFFSSCKTFLDTDRRRFQAKYEVNKQLMKKVFPKGRWVVLRRQWALTKIISVMDEAFRSATVRNDLSRSIFVGQLQKSGIGRGLFQQLAADEWRQRRMQLPTRGQKMALAAIKDLVAEPIPVGEMTQQRVMRKMGVSAVEGKWLQGAVKAARYELIHCGTTETNTDVMNRPSGAHLLHLPPQWIDLDSDIWDLRSCGDRLLRRSGLREDLANIAWSQMREALIHENLSPRTVGVHYTEYRLAGELLGSTVQDVRKATLESVQRAWVAYDGKPSKRQGARAALKRIFYHLCHVSKGGDDIDYREMLIIASWLSTSVVIRSTDRCNDFLSDSEMKSVIAGCLVDIKAGMDFTQSNRDLVGLSTLPHADGNASPVVNWAVALMILVMMFTGLRRQSVDKIKIGDWAEIYPGAFALIWRHTKKREEKVAVIAASLARLLDIYVFRTEAVRVVLRTDYAFLTRNVHGWWSAPRNWGYPQDCLKQFTARHLICRNGQPLRLNCQMFRRTYVTRELYDGRSIWALSLQLGHETIRTTQRYGKLDQFEHPAEVGAALDEYGRRALALWHQPLLLADLDPAERERLLGLKTERDQEVGLCRFGSCVKSAGGSPPPCSLCEHLVTGPEFSRAWEAEKEMRHDEIKRLLSAHGTGHLLGQKEAQLEMFEANFAFARGDERR